MKGGGTVLECASGNVAEIGDLEPASHECESWNMDDLCDLAAANEADIDDSTLLYCCHGLALRIESD